MSSDAELGPGASDEAFAALLAAELAPPERGVDEPFVARVALAVVEAERYRRWRRRIAGQLIGEAMVLAALAASLAIIARAEAVQAVLAEAPELAWPAALPLLLIWLITRRAPRTVV
ncbi:MAG TPA: hypothetical protein VGX37_09545 [Allosphingosinicella sp.]|nr:hypothetical protein [Allosphingosinicella sp.]